MLTLSRWPSLMIMVALTQACSPAPGAEPTEASKSSERPAPAPAETGARVTITAAEAEAAGLPKLGFSLDPSSAGMSGSKLVDGLYLRLSGPPGGPLMLLVSPATVGADFSSLVSAELLDGPLLEQQVELLGATRRAVAWSTGAGHARTSWCGVILGPADAGPNDAALLLELGVGHPDPSAPASCAAALSSPSLGPVVASLSLE
jgi:hypothetical protein